MKPKRAVKAVALIAAIMVSLAPGLPYGGGRGEAAPEITGGDPAPFYYTVKEGDSLWNLAEKFKVGLELLAAANGLDPDGILPAGIEVVIPAGGTTFYKVKPGDTLYGIAKSFGTTADILMEKNRVEDEYTLQPGTVLLVPVEVPALGGDGSIITVFPQYKVWPVRGVISSVFGPRNGRMHEGLDIAAEESTPIRTVADGVVVFAGERGSYGNTVIVNHGGGFRTLYAHASTLEVSYGDRVNAGDVIARVGSTGRSTGPHLHIEVLYRGIPLDPEKCLPGYQEYESNR